MSEVVTEIFGDAVPGDGLPAEQRRWAMFTYLIGLSMSVLDGNIANTALPSIASQLGASPEASIWVVNAFLLAVAVCVLPLSSLADIIGYKRVYQGGLALFTLASIGCSLPHSLATLILARIFQGVAAAAMWSISAAMIRYTYPKRLLGRAVGLSGIVIFTAAAAGPSIASGILAIATWHWLFAINVPFGLLSLSLSERFLLRAPGSRHRWDLWSGVLNAATVTLLITAIEDVGIAGRERVIIAELIGAAILAVLLVRRQVSVRNPMLAVDLLERPIFAMAAAASFCAFMGQGLAFVVLPFYFIDGLGVSQVRAGLLLTPWPLAAGVMSHFAGRLADRYPFWVLGTTGMALMTGGLLLLGLAPAHPTTFQIVWRAALGGAGFGFFGAPNNRALVANAPRERAGGAGGISTMSRLMGQSIGIAVVAMIFGLTAHGQATLHSATLALVAGSAFTILAAVVCFGSIRHPHIEPA
ncbi:MAG: MFS transporter [Acidobacteriota bacterium]|nr:MFS transporter [Acidobacteriota bacterium]MDE3168912.1 MFS transporter [Acidobacteriota bacterium]